MKTWRFWTFPAKIQFQLSTRIMTGFWFLDRRSFDFRYSRSNLSNLTLHYFCSLESFNNFIPSRKNRWMQSYSDGESWRYSQGRFKRSFKIWRSYLKSKPRQRIWFWAEQTRIDHTCSPKFSAIKPWLALQSEEVDQKSKSPIFSL